MPRIRVALKAVMEIKTKGTTLDFVTGHPSKKQTVFVSYEPALFVLNLIIWQPHLNI